MAGYKKKSKRICQCHKKITYTDHTFPVPTEPQILAFSHHKASNVGRTGGKPATRSSSRTRNHHIAQAMAVFPSKLGFLNSISNSQVENQKICGFLQTSSDSRRLRFCSVSKNSTVVRSPTRPSSCLARFCLSTFAKSNWAALP